MQNSSGRLHIVLQAALSLILPISVSAQNPAPVQTFYLPLPAAQFLQTLQTIEGGTTWIDAGSKPANPVQYYASIAAVSAGTVIYYDQMEDGYEVNISSPGSLYDALSNPSGTQIWGDGDPANGAPPGIPNDVINAGTVIIFNNPIDTTAAPNAQAPLFRGGDKMASSKAIAVTYAGWATGSATLFAGANEVFDTVSWGTDYRIPVGENIPDSTDYQLFEYAGAAIMAGEGGASVQIDANADGTFETTISLLEGQSHLINGGLSVGARILASRAVQVDLLTGDRQDGYESRFFRLLPTSLWASNYYTSVSTPASAQGTAGSSTSVWLYNPTASAINVTYQRRGLANPTSNVTNNSVSYASQAMAGSSPGNVYGQIVELNNDGTLTGASPEGAWIGIVNRSAANSPTIESKVTNAQLAGAAAVIIVREAGATTYPTETAGTPVIPVVGMTQNGGASLRAAGLGAGWVRVSGDQVNSIVTIPPASYISQLVADGYGGRFFAAGGEKFYALSATDSGGTTLSNDVPGSNRTWNWGYTLVPESSLTPQVLVGLGIGRDPTSALGLTENGNPAWVTTTGNGNNNAIVFVDYDANPLTGPLTDTNGNKYDLALTIREYESVKVYNPSGNQTGLLLYTLTPGVKLAAAWGQDVLQSSAGQPGLDIGTGIPPLPQFVGSKRSSLFVDNDSDGFVSPGDVLEYAITITNISRVPVSDLSLEDLLPPSLSYVANTTRFKDSFGVISTIPDGLAGTPFPIDEGGIIISQSSLPPNGATWEVSYRTLVVPATNLTPGQFNIINSATIGGVSVSDPIRLQESQVIYGQIGDRVWNDLNANGLQDSGEPGIPGITVRLLNSSNVVEETTITGSSGLYRFKGVLPGDYRIEFTTPTGFSFSSQNADGTGVLGANNSDASPLTGRSQLFTLSTGQHQLALDAGLVAVVGPLEILKSSNVTSVVAPGATIDYTVVVTNSGTTEQTNVSITDILPSNTDYVVGSVQAVIDPPLSAGGTFTTNYTTSGSFTVPAGVTSVTAEVWGAGGGGGKSSASNDNAGGGGGGGGFAKGVISATPGSSLSFHVGAGGAAATNGEDSWFAGLNSIRGAGGLGGGGSSVTGGAGGTSNLGSLQTWSGGQGGNGHAAGTNSSRRGGGGGGSATATANGGPGANGGSNSGGGGGSGEAAGGSGNQGSTNGAIGNSPGGGGGGGGRNGIGGIGGNGRVRVTYTVPAGVAGALAAPPNLASGWTLPAGGTLTVTFQATVKSPALGTQVINTASVTSTQSPTPATSTVFDTLAPGTISGLVLADNNNDNLGDVGIGGVTVTLFSDPNGDGNPADGVAVGSPTTTSIAGNYSFANVIPGNYVVVQTQPADYFTVTDLDTTNPGDDLSNSSITDNAIPVTILSNETDDGNTFVEELPGSITGTVTTLTGGNPISGVVLTLKNSSGADIDSDPVTAGVQPTTTTTNGSGVYLFSNLLPASYRVVETQPAGYLSISDVDGTNNNIIGDQTPIVVAAGATVTGRNFVEELPGSITGTVTTLTGGNPISGVTLTLKDSSGADIDSDPVTAGVQPTTTTTNGSGVYLFSNLLPASYRVVETQPVGYLSISDVDGTNNNIIGDQTPIVVAAGATVTGRNFVEELPGSITGTVTTLTGGNPISGVVLTLKNSSGADIDSDPVTAGVQPTTTTTNGSGVYFFSNLLPASYRVVETQPAGYLSISDVDGTNNNIIGDQTPIVVAAGATVTGRNFVEELPGSITGTVTTLTGGNPISGVVLTLKNSSGADIDSDPVTAGVQPTTTTTNRSGVYLFSNLLPANYRVVETQPAGYLSIGDVDGTNNNIIGDQTPIIVAAGATVTGRNFVEELPGTITGTVTTLTGSNPISGVVITLKNSSGADIDSDPVTAGVQPTTTTTNGSGVYLFSNLLPASYRVVETQPAGYLSISDVDGTNNNIIGDQTPIVVAAGATVTGRNFVEELPGSITGTVTTLTGSNPISGVVLTLKNSSGADIDSDPVTAGVQPTTTTTNGSGVYLFSKLLPASYRVVETQPAGYLSISDVDGTNNNIIGDQTPIVVAAGATVTGRNFVEELPGAITGHLYLDTNGNGTQDSGEPNLANIDVIITDSLNTTQTVTTDANGNWTATVAPGSTTADVQESDPQFPAGVTQTQGDDPTIVTAVAGSSVNGGIDGYYLPATVTGHIYFDRNGNETQDSGEPDLVNVDVLVTDSLGNIQIVFTDSNGDWSASVPPGATTAAVDVAYAERVLKDSAKDVVKVSYHGPIHNASVVVNSAVDGSNTGISFTISGSVLTIHGVTSGGKTTADILNAWNSPANAANRNSGFNLSAPPNPDATALLTAKSNSPLSYDPATLNDIPAGATQTEGTDPTTVTAIAGSSVDGGIDGFFLPATVTGHVYFDTNGNETQDSGELDLANVDVIVTDLLGNTQIVFTDANGDWTASVPPGATTAAVNVAYADRVLKDGFKDVVKVSYHGPILNASVVVNSAVDGSNTGISFTISGSVLTIHGVTVSGKTLADILTAWNSPANAANRTLGFDLSFPPIPDFTALLKAAASRPLVYDPATLNDIPAGATQTEGTDPTTVVAIAGISVDGGIDGFFLPATVTGHLYLDTNGNETQDIGEPDLANVDVIVTDSFGNTQTVSTDGNGDWTVSVPPGSTSAEVNILDSDFPVGYAQTEGSNPTIVIASAGANTDAGVDGFAPMVDLGVEKSVNNATPLVGSQVTFTIEATNHGPLAATGVVVTDVLPSGYTFVSANPPAAYDSGTGVWTIGAMNHQDTASLTITVTVESSGTYLNVASIDGDQRDSVSSNNSDDAATTPIQLGSISGAVLVDTDNNGLGDAFLGGQLLSLVNGSGGPVLDTNGQPRTTLSSMVDGTYSFGSLPPGTYGVVESQPAGYVSLSDKDGGNLDEIRPIIVLAGETNTGNDFVEISNCPDTWADWKQLHPSETASGNPDQDAYDNFAEFAFAMPYDQGTTGKWLEGTGWIIRPSTLAPGTLEGVFVRPKGAPTNVKYIIEYAVSLANTISWNSLDLTNPLLGVTTTDNGDCTEKVTIHDLESLPGLGDGKGVVRIRAELDEEPGTGTDHVSYTEVEGWKETVLEICCRTFNNPYQRESIFTGTVSAVNGRELTFAANDDLDQLLSAGGTYYLEVVTGDQEGQRFDIVSSDAATLTLASDLNFDAHEPPFNTSVDAVPADLPANLIGDTVRVHRHWSLDELFPPSGFGAKDDQSDADQVQVFAGGGWRIYWLYDLGDSNPATAEWRLGPTGAIDQGATIIPPGQGLFFNNRTSPTSILAYGEIRNNDFIRPLAVGSNLVGGGYPVDQSPNGPLGRSMNLASFWGSTDFKTADSIFIWKADNVITASGFETYFLLDGRAISPSLVRWARVGDSALLARDSEALLLGNRSAFVRSKNAVPQHKVTQPWNP